MRSHWDQLIRRLCDERSLRRGSWKHITQRLIAWWLNIYIHVAWWLVDMVLTFIYRKASLPYDLVKCGVSTTVRNGEVYELFLRIMMLPTMEETLEMMEDTLNLLVRWRRVTTNHQWLFAQLLKNRSIGNPWQGGFFKSTLLQWQVSSEQNPSYLLKIGDEILPNHIWITISQ